mmetsp:Transcript_51750/g.121501  ORF Transcript_51750/g.121501 Transcript_51750/m.121501 type:complete len:589 (+) Transcript_51750:242-2008(+)
MYSIRMPAQRSSMLHLSSIMRTFALLFVFSSPTFAFLLQSNPLPFGISRRSSAPSAVTTLRAQARRPGRIGSATARVGLMGQQFKPSSRSTSTLFLVEELTTDDGLNLWGKELREARSNWVSDIMSTGNSRVLKKISARLGVSSVWAMTVALFFACAPADWKVNELFEVPGWPHELVGGFLAILLVFRTDQAYERFWEARKMWAELNGVIRSLSRVAVTKTDGDQLDEILAHLCAFPVALKQHLRGERNPTEIEVVFESFDAKRQWEDDNWYNTIDAIMGANNMPVTLLTSLSLALAKPHATSKPLPEHVEQHIEAGVDRLAGVVAQCEAIKCTPIPLSYSRHTSRFFTLFSLTLPFALVEQSALWLVAPITAGISWVLFATEEIGHVIEEPFGNGLAQEQDMAEIPELSEERLRSVFEFFDTDRSGSIDKTEFFLAMQKLGVSMPAEQVDEYVERFDDNGNELLEYEEFIAILEDAASERMRLRDPKGSSDLAMGSTVANVLGKALVEGITGFYMVIGMVFGIELERGGVRQLEVLPLARYCTTIQRDVLQQAVLISTGSKRKRYMTMAQDLGRTGGRQGLADEVMT